MGSKELRLSTPVALEGSLPAINYESRVVSLGSCFSQYIGERLQALKMRALVNPFGVLFNPESIALCLERTLQDRPVAQQELLFWEGLYHSPLHHGSFSGEDAQRVLEGCRKSQEVTRQALEGCTHLILTWGSAWVYELAHEKGRVVANCHKMPQRFFLRRLLQVDEIVERYQGLLESLQRVSAKVKVLLQVSPVRHLGDGLHGNQISKATLLLAAERLRERFPEVVFYFPSYEILLDELRDYRFFDQDMAHPSLLAQQIICQRFLDGVLDEKTLRVAVKVEQIERLLAHRLLHPSEAAVKQHMDLILEKVQEIRKIQENIDFSKEIESCQTRLMESLRY